MLSFAEGGWPCLRRQVDAMSMQLAPKEICLSSYCPIKRRQNWVQIGRVESGVGAACGIRSCTTNFVPVTV